MADAGYAITSDARSGGKSVPIADLAAAFGRAAVRQGFSFHTQVVRGDVATVMFSQNVPFDEVSQALKAVSSAFNVNIYLAPTMDVAGQHIDDLKASDAADQIRRTRILMA